MTFVEQPDLGPVAVTHDLGTHHIVSSWEVRDMTHWRVDIHILQPTLQSETMVAVANGSSAIFYREISNVAVSFRLTSPSMGLALLSEFQGSGGVPLAQTLEQYLQELNNPRSHTHARAVGQQQILGRTADGIEIWPVVHSASGPCNNAVQCAKQEKGYGRALMWIDHEHGLVLRFEEHGIPAMQSSTHGFVYRVTSLAVGIGPSTAELSYRPPVQPVANSDLGIVSKGSASAGPRGDGRWKVPAGFIAIGAPRGAGSQPYILAGTGSSQDSGGGTSMIDAQYSLGRTPTDLNQSPRGPFVYVQEQYRSTGLPRGYATSARHTAGSCTSYTGTYPDGLHWLALARGKVSLLAVANHLKEQGLVRWVATQVCR
jgi:hypothetical protein